MQFQSVLIAMVVVLMIAANCFGEEAKKDKVEEAAVKKDQEKVETVDNKIPDDWLEGNAQQRMRLAGLEKKEILPKLELKDWINGEAVSLESLKGKVVLLDFWATWCGPCIASIPRNNELQRKYGEKGLVVIGVCHPRGADKMKQTVEGKGIEYLVAKDVEGKSIQSYAVNGFPDYYLIDRSGKLRIADCKNSKGG